jgi:hypothetical protein
MTGLLPCPFCGGKALLHKYASMVQIECANDEICVVQADLKIHDPTMVDEAIRLWNTRVPLSGSPAQGSGDCGAMREALKPFAAFADALAEEVPDDIALGIFAGGAMRFGPSGGSADVGSLRKARASLALSSTSQNSEAP